MYASRLQPSISVAPTSISSRALYIRITTQGSVKVLYSPTVEEIKLQLKMFAPTLVYLAAGYQQHKEDRPPTLNSLILQHAGSSGIVSC